MRYAILLFAAIALPPLTDYLVDIQFSDEQPAYNDQQRSEMTALVESAISEDYLTELERTL